MESQTIALPAYGFGYMESQTIALPAYCYEGLRKADHSTLNYGLCIGRNVVRGVQSESR